MELSLSNANRRYGFIPSRPDHRDFGIAGLSLSLQRPKSVDLEDFCGKVKDQGQLGACTAFAGSGNREYLLRKFEGKTDIVSPLFLYYMERKLDGTLSDGDCGSTGRSSCIAMKDFGVSLESIDPYNVNDFQQPPTNKQLSDALNRRAGAYHGISNMQDMKSCLASGYPMIFCFSVYDSFESQQTAETGIMPIPDVNREQLLGGHATLMIGYDDSKQAFKVRNSWGSSWGQSGNFWVPYEVANSDIVLEVRIQHLGKPW